MLISALSLSTMAFGTPAGTTTPLHVVTSNPGTPASEIVGSSGIAGERLRLVTPSARTRPAFTCGVIDARLSKTRCTRPAITSVIAA